MINLSQIRSPQIGSKKQNGPTKKISKAGKGKVLDIKFKMAQQKLIEQINQNYQLITQLKEQKAQIAEQVFKFCES